LLEAKDVMQQKKAGEEPDDMDLIGGTTEDDFTEAMSIIRCVLGCNMLGVQVIFDLNCRERELLYGENSILSNFGPLVSEICANNIVYKVCGIFFLPTRRKINDR
jgi:condensin complex subunit 1